MTAYLQSIMDAIAHHPAVSRQMARGYTKNPAQPHSAALEALAAFREARRCAKQQIVNAREEGRITTPSFPGRRLLMVALGSDGYMPADLRELIVMALGGEPSQEDIADAMAKTAHRVAIRKRMEGTTQ